MIAMQYMFTGMFMALIGGFIAYVFRMQLAFPGIEVPGWGMVSPADYNTLITNHGAIMIFWVAMPVLIAAFGNFLIPLMIGCDAPVAMSARTCRFCSKNCARGTRVLSSTCTRRSANPGLIEAMAGIALDLHS